MREQGWLMCGGESGEVWGERSKGRHCGREVWGGICVCVFVSDGGLQCGCEEHA